MTRRFGGVVAVRGVDLHVARGERRTVIGPNGAGKTTLFNLIAGDFAVTSGRIELGGRNVTGDPARRRAAAGLTRTYQQSRLFGGLTIEDNLLVALAGAQGGRLSLLRRRRRDRERRDRAAGLLRRVGLTGQDRIVTAISHGEQRQLELAMALAGEPKLLLLDEPAAGLAPGERVALVELLRTLERDVTLLLIEHDMDVALTVADRVTMMHDGRVVFEGSPDEVRSSPLVHDLYLGRAHGAVETTTGGRT